MKPGSQTLIYFSPTRTTQKVLSAISANTGIGITEQLDLTPPDTANTGIKKITTDLAIIGAPVYGGRLPLEAVKRLKQVSGNGTPAVIVAVYGNREYEDALLELKDIATEADFLPVAAAAFIGEHSFSSKAMPIAHGRPDAVDLEAAGNFGDAVGKKLSSIGAVHEDDCVKVPGNFPYKERKTRKDTSPDTNAKTCTLCGNCADACPTSAISISESVVTDKGLCIICCACVKTCPTGARVMQDPGVQKATDWLHTNYFARKEPELFI